MTDSDRVLKTIRADFHLAHNGTLKHFTLLGHRMTPRTDDNSVYYTYTLVQKNGYTDFFSLFVDPDSDYFNPQVYDKEALKMVFNGNRKTMTPMHSYAFRHKAGRKYITWMPDDQEA